MHRDEAWDVGEMSLATLYMLADKGDVRFVPIPVFPSREFRHASLYVRADGAILKPMDLCGRTVGVLRYAMTTAVWVRGFLAVQYGVPRAQLHWVVGDDSVHPQSIVMRRVDGAEALEQMAIKGEIDCLISSRTPKAYLEGKLRRLFSDFGAEEKAFFARNGAFPIMHAMAVRRTVVEQQADAISALLRRFESAKHFAEQWLHDFDVSVYPVPWLAAHVEDAIRRMGDLWPYGLDKNRATLTVFGQFMADDELTRGVLLPEQVFPAAYT